MFFMKPVLLCRMLSLYNWPIFPVPWGNICKNIDFWICEVLRLFFFFIFLRHFYKTPFVYFKEKEDSTQFYNNLLFRSLKKTNQNEKLNLWPGVNSWERQIWVSATIWPWPPPPKKKICTGIFLRGEDIWPKPVIIYNKF